MEVKTKFCKENTRIFSLKGNKSSVV